MKENNNTTNTINAGGMSIKVTVTPMQNQDGCLKANASIILNDVFKVTGIRIGISQKGNIFVSMPDYKTGRLDDNGKDVYQDIAYPVTRQFRQELYDEIVKEFNAVMGQEEQRTGGKE
ncbi:putative septation protein SpoVG [Lachnospiraceae bacterium]|nr:putative septation protein SpoVG [Lachnospiraceae bacterium]